MNSTPQKKSTAAHILLYVVIVGMCFVYCAVKFPNFWSLLLSNTGAFLGLFASSLLLIPVAAVFAWVAMKAWIVSESPGRPAFITTLAASMILTVALFIGIDCLIKLRTANDTIITLDDRMNLLKDKLMKTQDDVATLRELSKLQSESVGLLQSLQSMSASQTSLDELKFMLQEYVRLNNRQNELHSQQIKILRDQAFPKSQ